MRLLLLGKEDPLSIDSSKIDAEQHISYIFQNFSYTEIAQKKL